MPAKIIEKLNAATNEWEPMSSFGPIWYTDKGDAPTLTHWYDYTGNCYCSEPNYRFATYLDKEWREREAHRFERFNYQALPWDLEPIADHFAHVSVSDGAMVAFTENANKGERDVQTKMKPGRYLTKFYPHLSGDEVRELATRVDRAIEVKFATTREAWVEVYCNGPHSCMAYPLNDEHWNVQDTHPVEVYCAGDLELAYLASCELGQDGFRASSRAIVWPAKKVYKRIYGDRERMQAALEALGYSEGVLQGARMLKIMEGEAFVVPYLDCGHRAREEGDFLIIDNQGEVDCEVTCGLAEDNLVYCDYYEERRQGPLVYIRDREENWCQDAANEHAFYCQGNGDHYSYDTTEIEIDGETYSEDYVDTYGFYCERTHQHYLRPRRSFHHGRSGYDQSVMLEDTNETVCLSYAQEHCHQICGEWYAEPSEEGDVVTEAEEAPSVPEPASEPARGFLVGDVVRCRNASMSLGLTEGETYTIAAVHDVLLTMEGHDNAWAQSRFEMVRRPLGEVNPFKAGDYVTTDSALSLTHGRAYRVQAVEDRWVYVTKDDGTVDGWVFRIFEMAARPSASVTETVSVLAA